MKQKSLKSYFEEYFQTHGVFTTGKMYFRPYNPKVEDIVNHFSTDDWCKIFPNLVEDDLKDLSSCVNVIILVWCDKATNKPRGMVYFEENFHNRNEVSFHGGTWDHNRRFYKEIFYSLVKLFDFVLLHKKVLSTTCGIDNNRANKFQESLCFKEVTRDGVVIYKTLDILEYNNSDFINKLT